jgi:hypothetical protein
MLIQGEWMLDNKGIMDRTHLRWFTPQSYRRMFENCGYIVDDVGPVRALGAKGSLGCFLTFGRAEHLLFRQVNLKAHVAAAAEAHR